MADVRSLLRAERESRRTNHPQAASSSSSKKRKAIEEDGDGRKKAKVLEMVNGLPAGFFEQTVNSGADGEDAGAVKTNQEKPVAEVVNNGIAQQHITPSVTSPSSSSVLPPGFFESGPEPRPPQNGSIDEDEWAAFERDIASPPPASPSFPPSALNAEATISAAPLTAAELAVRSAEEANLQKKDRVAAEIEGEKEDAARQLDEEFDEMEGLENRVRKLREKREALRRRRQEEASGEPVEAGEGTDDIKPEDGMGIPIRIDGAHDKTHDEATYASESEDDEDSFNWDDFM